MIYLEDASVYNIVVVGMVMLLHVLSVKEKLFEFVGMYVVLENLISDNFDICFIVCGNIHTITKRQFQHICTFTTCFNMPI